MGREPWSDRLMVEECDKLSTFDPKIKKIIWDSEVTPIINVSFCDDTSRPTCPNQWVYMATSVSCTETSPNTATFIASFGFSEIESNDELDQTKVTPDDSITVICIDANPSRTVIDYGIFDLSGLEYLPADANMAAGSWPPAVIGADVTYLVNYFRGQSEPCLLDGFYASGDANGDCNVFGSDVTYPVNYFRGQNAILYCPDYEPARPIPADVTVDIPAEWPNCEMPVLGSE